MAALSRPGSHIGPDGWVEGRSQIWPDIAASMAERSAA
jgi:hypothetical protein